MSVKFRCKQSGNVFEYFTEHDIKTMRTHLEYEEVPEETVKDKELNISTPTKKVGRPAKPKEE